LDYIVGYWILSEWIGLDWIGCELYNLASYWIFLLWITDVDPFPRIDEELRYNPYSILLFNWPSSSQVQATRLIGSTLCLFVNANHTVLHFVCNRHIGDDIRNCEFNQPKQKNPRSKVFVF
jgi:hypothetical protein